MRSVRRGGRKNTCVRCTWEKKICRVRKSSNIDRALRACSSPQRLDDFFATRPPKGHEYLCEPRVFFDVATRFKRGERREWVEETAIFLRWSHHFFRKLGVTLLRGVGSCSGGVKVFFSDLYYFLLITLSDEHGRLKSTIILNWWFENVVHTFNFLETGRLIIKSSIILDW